MPFYLSHIFPQCVIACSRPSPINSLKPMSGRSACSRSKSSFPGCNSTPRFTTTRENPFADPIHPFQIFTCRDLPNRPALCQHQWPLLHTSLFCYPSIFAQALRAAIMAAKLPLRGKLRVEATTIFSLTNASWK